MTHVRICTVGGKVDTAPVPLPFVPGVGEILVWEGAHAGWYTVVERWFYCFAGFPSVTLVVEPRKEPSEATA